MKPKTFYGKCRDCVLRSRSKNRSRSLSLFLLRRRRRVLCNNICLHVVVHKTTTTKLITLVTFQEWALLRVSFFKWAKPILFLFIFVLFTWQKNNTNTLNDKSNDGVLGTRTWGSRMLGTDKSGELWRHPSLLGTNIAFFLSLSLSDYNLQLVVQKKLLAQKMIKNT